MKFWSEFVILLLSFESVNALSGTFYEFPRNCGDVQVNDTYQYTSLEFTSIIQCSVACQQDPKCYSLVYHDNQCRLFSMILLKDCSSAVAKTQQFYFEKAGCFNGGYQISSDKCQCVDGYIAEKCHRLMYDCKEGFGAYPQQDLRLQIQPSPSVQPFRVHCQMRYSGRSYILYHVSTKTSLNQSWIDYRHGFGDLDGDHWLGLDHLSSIVNSREARGQSARLTLETRTSEGQFQEHHSDFLIGDVTDNYKIKSVGSHSGSLSDCMTDLVGSMFATYDHGSDHGMSCAVQYGGGWWFGNNCARCNPVGTVPSDGIRLNVTYEKFWPEVESSLSRIKIWIE